MYVIVFQASRQKICELYSHFDSQSDRMILVCGRTSETQLLSCQNTFFKVYETLAKVFPCYFPHHATGNRQHHKRQKKQKRKCCTNINSRVHFKISLTNEIKIIHQNILLNYLESSPSHYRGIEVCKRLERKIPNLNMASIRAGLFHISLRKRAMCIIFYKGCLNFVTAIK